MEPESLEEIRAYVEKQLNTEVWEEEQRFENPHEHYLDMSPAYYEMKMDMLGLMSMNMTISGDYKTTDKTPAVEPPAGAVVVPFEELGMETAAPETAA